MGIRDNKLIRLAQLRNKNVTGVDLPPTVEEQLTRLEDDIRRLKIEFDIYFNGAAKRPPYDTKNRVETIIKRLGDDRTLNFAQRYRYNTLASRFTAFRELWRRTLQGREEGRDAVSAARAAAHAEAGRFDEAMRYQTQALTGCTELHSSLIQVRQRLALYKSRKPYRQPI